MSDSKVRVVHVSICTDSGCQVVDISPHLIVRLDLVSLTRGNAAAISYTWGRFDRQYCVIGHDANGNKISLELGVEWRHDLVHFMHALSDICKENQYLWMDQFCIRQNDSAEVKRVLAQIPDIFRNLDVIVLLPGGRCECQKEAWEVIKSGVIPRASSMPGLSLGARSFRRVKRNTLEDRFFGKSVSCLNNVAFGIWFSRIWTFQELIYAQRLRVKWILPETVSHIATEPVAFSLGTLMERIRAPDVPIVIKLEAEEIIATMPPESESMDSYSPDFPFFTTSLKHWLRAYQSVRIWYPEEEVEAAGKLSTIFWDALNGVELEKPRNKKKSTASSTSAAAEFIVQQVMYFRDSVRSATKAHDYVIPVWIDCPGYIIPDNYKTMGLGNLLDDALIQLQQNHGITVTATTPAGVFGMHSPAVLWRPSIYLGTIHPKTAQDVYGPVSIDDYKVRVLSGNTFPITHKRPLGASLSERRYIVESFPLQDYQSIYKSMTPSEAVESFLEASLAWDQERIGATVALNNWLDGMAYNEDDNYETDDTTLLAQSSLTSPLPDSSIRSPFLKLWYYNYMFVPKGLGTGVRSAIFKKISTYVRQIVVSDLAEDTSNLENEDHYDVLYDFICDLLGLSSEAAKAKGLRLMIDKGEMVVKGTTQRYVRAPRYGLTWVNFSTMKNDQKTYTVLCSPAHPNPQTADIDTPAPEAKSRTLNQPFRKLAKAVLEPLGVGSQRDPVTHFRTHYEVIKEGVDPETAISDDNGNDSTKNYRVIGVWVPSCTLTNRDIPKELQSRVEAAGGVLI